VRTLIATTRFGAEEGLLLNMMTTLEEYVGYHKEDKVWTADEGMIRPLAFELNSVFKIIEKGTETVINNEEEAKRSSATAAEIGKQTLQLVVVTRRRQQSSSSLLLSLLAIIMYQ
jgi:hypothetical protein